MLSPCLFPTECTLLGQEWWLGTNSLWSLLLIFPGFLSEFYFHFLSELVQRL